MRWTAAEASLYRKDLTPEEQEIWAEAANKKYTALAGRGFQVGGTLDSTCITSAVLEANRVIDRMKEAATEEASLVVLREAFERLYLQAGEPPETAKRLATLSVWGR